MLLLSQLSEFACTRNLHIIILDTMEIEGWFRVDRLLNALFCDNRNRVFKGDISLIALVVVLNIKGLDRERSLDILDDFEVVNHIRAGSLMNEKEILCVPLFGSFNYKFNRSHPLIKPLFNSTGYKSNQSRMLFKELSFNFCSIMEIAVDKIDVNDREWLKVLRRGTTAK
ncbi:hypothetical protein PDN28_14215 [Bacillus cereus]|uniref:hypothetical protein n=1 Tax=Bacillus cereus group sp. MYBK215-1 TaxID=3450665 RepID=UPI002A4C3F0D|nr:hypothetical protein [Bacillus cereus]HDR8122823.1 hypothetical protein [Bacillus cereus]